MRYLSARLVVVVVTLSAGGASAADSPPEHLAIRRTAGLAETRRELRQKRQEISAQIAAIADRRTKDDREASEADDEQLALLRSIDAVEFHHESLLEQQEQLESELADADARLAKLGEFAPDEPKPYSFLLLEGLKDQLADEQREEAALKTDIKSAEQLLAAAHDELDKAAARRRAASGAGSKETSSQAQSAKSNTADKTATEKTAAAGSEVRQLGLQLAVTLAREKVALGRTNVEVAKLRLAASSARQKQLAKKIAVVEKDVEFSRHDRDTELGRLSALEAGLDKRRIAAETRFHKLEVQGEPAKPATSGKAPATETTPELRAAGEFYDAILLLLDQQREQLATERGLWRDRYQLAQGKLTDEQAKKSLKGVEDFLANLSDWSQAWEHRFNALSDQPVDGHEQREVAGRTAAVEQAPEGVFRDFSSAYAAARREIRHARQGLERFRDELKARLATSAGHGAKFVSVLGSIWNWEVLSDEKEQGVSLGKLVILLLYILAGLMLAYIASWLVGSRILHRLGWHRGKAAALKSILFYALCLFFGAVAFRALRVPLGAFAFLGGAAAIAVGFGCQDIMNNFMSGIILLTEQPIRVGDVIELGGEQGKVTYIGLRSTRLLTEANHELIVANKMLLDEQVKNLTLSDQFVQTTITIDVDRNLPVAETKRKMLELTFSHPMVIKTNRPVVLLTEVDGYALRFQIHFWIEYHGFMKSATVQSEVLEMITAEFPSADGSPAPASVEEATDAEGDVAENASLEPKTVGETGPSGPADRPAAGGIPKGQSAAAATGRATGIDRETASDIRKMSRAVVKKEIRRGLR